MSKKHKTKSQKEERKITAEEPKIVISEVGLGEEKLEDEKIVEEDEELELEKTGVAGKDEKLTEDLGSKRLAGGLGSRRLARDLEGKELDRGLDVGLDTERAANKRSGLYRINIQYPWLKFVAVLVLVAGMLAGGFGIGRAVRGVISGAENDSSVEVVDSDIRDAEESDLADGDSTEGNSVEDGSAEEKPEEKVEEKPQEQSQGQSSEQPKEEMAEKPAATTKTPVVVPETGGKKLVALTFDDGPSAATTGRLLDILKAKGVKATFFVVGSMANRAPELLKREAAEGHEVGGHSAFHQNLSKVSAAEVQADVANMDQIFMNTLGRKMEIMRPPYGAVSDAMRGYLGRPMICWSVDPEDWKYRNAATVRANVVGATTDGAIVLMHDIYASTVDAVAGIIDDLRAQGYEFLTVSELATARGIGLTSGVVYYNFRP